MSGVTLDVTDCAPVEERDVVERELVAFNAVHAGISDARDLAVLIRDQAGDVVGGLIGKTARGWLVIDLLFVPESLRRSGTGRRVMDAAEAEAVRRGCRNARVSTYSFQAPDFYPKLGYEVYGVLDDYPGEVRSYFLRKHLVARPV